MYLFVSAADLKYIVFVLPGGVEISTIYLYSQGEYKYSWSLHATETGIRSVCLDHWSEAGFCKEKSTLKICLINFSSRYRFAMQITRLEYSNFDEDWTMSRALDGLFLRVEFYLLFDCTRSQVRLGRCSPFWHDRWLNKRIE